MKRYSVFAARFALVPMISGPFVTGTASWLARAHILSGIATIYLILILLLKAAKNRQIRLQAALALLLGMTEAIPGMPRLHAAVSPLLFAALAWALISVPDGSAPVPEQRPAQIAKRTRERSPDRSKWIFAVPAAVVLPILYGVSYRHQTSGFLPHVGAALLVGGFLVMFSMVLKERHAADARLCLACNLTIAAVLVQIVFGIGAFVIRLLEIENGLLLAVARTLHFTGAAPVLAASTELAIQYRRGTVVELAAS
jgi:hypothetical protein